MYCYRTRCAFPGPILAARPRYSPLNRDRAGQQFRPDAYDTSLYSSLMRFYQGNQRSILDLLRPFVARLCASPAGASPEAGPQREQGGELLDLARLEVQRVALAILQT